MGAVDAEGRPEVDGEGQAVLGADVGGEEHEGAEDEVGEEDRQDHLAEPDAALHAGGAEREGGDDDGDADPDPGVAPGADRALVEPGRQDRFLDEGVAFRAPARVVRLWP